MSRDVTALEAKAKELRRDIVKMIYAAQSGHLGGSLSEIDILTALFHGEMNYSGKNMDDPNRDRFVLSKGHTVPAQYAVFIASMHTRLLSFAMESIPFMSDLFNPIGFSHKTCFPLSNAILIYSVCIS